jgi:hypothetical protein
MVEGVVGVVGVVMGVRVRVERNKEQGQIGSTTILQPLRLPRPLLLLIPNNKCNKHLQAIDRLHTIVIFVINPNMIPPLVEELNDDDLLQYPCFKWPLWV